MATTSSGSSLFPAIFQRRLIDVPGEFGFSDISPFVEVLISPGTVSGTFFKPRVLHAARLLVVLAQFALCRRPLESMQAELNQAIDVAFRGGVAVGDYSEAINHLARHGYYIHPWGNGWDSTRSDVFMPGSLRELALINKCNVTY